MGNKILRNRVGKSGERYIALDNLADRFIVVIPINGKHKFIGGFKDLEDAILCRDKALTEYET